MKQTAVEWQHIELSKFLYGKSEFTDANDILIKAKEMEKIYYTEFEVLQLLIKLQQTESYDNLYDWFQKNKKQTFNTNEMTREEKLETIVKLFAKSMFYGDWKWETPTERVITMLMQEVDMYPFKDEDDMISKTPVSDELYKKAIKEVPPRQAKGWDESVSYKASEE